MQLVLTVTLQNLDDVVLKPICHDFGGITGAVVHRLPSFTSQADAFSLSLSS